MPPVVAAAGITAAAGLGAAALSSRANSKATDAQTKANAAALDYTKQKDAQTRADYERAYNEYLNDRANWEQGRAQLFERYGLQTPSYSPQQMPTAAPGGTPAGMAPRNAQYSPLAIDRVQRAALSGKTISDLLDSDAQGRKLAWNDWAKYNL